MKIAYFISAVALLAAPVSASAADAVFQHDVAPVAPIVAPVSYDWSGAYVGATAGVLAPKTGRFHVKGLKDGNFGGGVHAGYNHQLDNNIVLGVEGDANMFKTKRQLVSPKYLTSARVRAGYAIDRFLPYVDAGVVAGKLNGVDARGRNYTGHTHVGYTVGGGLEYAVTDNVSTRLSYHYVDLKNRDYTIGGTKKSVGFAGHTIGAGFSVKF